MKSLMIVIGGGMPAARRRRAARLWGQHGAGNSELDLIG